MVPEGEHQTREGGPKFSQDDVFPFWLPVLASEKRGGFWGGPPFFFRKKSCFFLFFFGVGGVRVFGVFHPQVSPKMMFDKSLICSGRISKKKRKRFRWLHF